MDPYSQAHAELAEIDSRIATLRQRRETLQKFIELGHALYGDMSVSVGGRSSLTANIGSAIVNAAQNLIPLDQRGTVQSVMFEHKRTAKARILAVCRAHIDFRGPTHTRDLLAAVAAAGIEVTGTDKVSTLSVLLSKSSEFRSDRKLGWSLITTHTEQTPLSAPTLAGSDVGSSIAPGKGTGQAAG